jgi:glutamate 5-kinase
MTEQSPQQTVQDIFNNATRIVIKIGSDLLVNPATLGLRTDWLDTLVSDIKNLHAQDKEIILVASGAVALGRAKAGFSPEQPLSVPEKRLSATWGQQHHTMMMFNAFTNAGIDVAAGLLIQPNHLLSDRKDQNNLRHSYDHVLSKNGVPVVNENDSVATEELRFGNNDVLAAQVSGIMNADLTLILSDIDGLYEEDPKKNQKAEHIPYVSEISDDILGMATEDTNASSTGGMKSKIEAVKIAWDSNSHVIIANGTIENPISRLLKGHEKATCFVKNNTPNLAIASN